MQMASISYCAASMFHMAWGGAQSVSGGVVRVEIGGSPCCVQPGAGVRPSSQLSPHRCLGQLRTEVLPKEQPFPRKPLRTLVLHC